MSPQVFISYASADKPVADQVCATLEAAGAACWIAPRNIPPGTDYPAAIVEGVAGAGLLVLILTEHALASPHIVSEVGHAFNGKKAIIPFRMTSAALPEDLEYFLFKTQWLDAPDGCTEQNLKRLTQAVLDALAGKRHSRVAAGGRRWKRWIGVVAAVALAAVAAMVNWKRPKEAASPRTQTAAIETALPTAPAAPPVIEKQQPKTRVNPADGLTYVWIPPGSFNMGCSSGDSECKDDEKPAHPV